MPRVSALPKGPESAERLRQWLALHPQGNQHQCAQALGVSHTQVRTIAQIFDVKFPIGKPPRNFAAQGITREVLRFLKEEKGLSRLKIALAIGHSEHYINQLYFGHSPKVTTLEKLITLAGRSFTITPGSGIMDENSEARNV